MNDDATNRWAIMRDRARSLTLDVSTDLDYRRLGLDHPNPIRLSVVGALPGPMLGGGCMYLLQQELRTVTNTACDDVLYVAD